MMNKRLYGIMKRSAALLMSVCLVGTSCYTNAWAAEEEDLEPVSCVVDVDLEKLQSGILTAIREEKKVTDFNSAEFFSDDEALIAEYEQLLNSKGKNPLYQVDYTFGKGQLPTGTSIRIFVRKEEKEVDYDLANRSADEMETTAEEVFDRGEIPEAPETADLPETAAEALENQAGLEGETAEAVADHDTEPSKEHMAELAVAEPQYTQEAEVVEAMEEVPDSVADQAAETAAADQPAETVAEDQPAETVADDRPAEAVEADQAESENTEAISEAVAEVVTEASVEEEVSSVQAETLSSDEYELTGNEAVYILYSNKTKRDVIFQLRINGCLTSEAYISSPKSLKEELKTEVPSAAVIAETTVEALETEESSLAEESMDETTDGITDETVTGTDAVPSEEATDAALAGDAETEPADTDVADSSEASADSTDSDQADHQESGQEQGSDNSADQADDSNQAADQNEAAEEADSNDAAEVQDNSADTAVEGQTLSMSRHEAPMVAAGNDSSIDDIQYSSVLMGSSRNTAVGMAMMSLGQMGVVSSQGPSLTVTNVLSEDSEEGMADYTVTISKSTGNETSDQDITSELQDGTNTFRFSLGHQESVTISNINPGASYRVVQEENANITRVKDPEATYETISGEVAEEGDDGSSSAVKDIYYGYSSEVNAYASLIDRAEALAEAVNRCSLDPENAGKMKTAVQKVLKDDDRYKSVKNESYRNRLVMDIGSWPLAKDAGLSSIIEASSAYEAKKSDTEKEAFLNSLYLSIYVRPNFNAAGENTPEVVPFITARTGENDWNAYFVYVFDEDKQDGWWYQTGEGKENGSIGSLNTKTIDQLLKSTYSSGKPIWVPLVKAGYERTPLVETGKTETEGSFTQNGKLLKVTITYTNQYQTPVVVEYVTVIFEDAEGTQIGEPVKVIKGQVPQAPAAPKVDGKKFVGWSQDLSQGVTSDLTVTAVYEDELQNDDNSNQLPPDNEGQVPPAQTPGEDQDTGSSNTDQDTGSSNTNQNTGGGSTGTSAPGRTTGYAQGGPGDAGSEGTVTVDPEQVPLASLPTNASNNFIQAMAVIDDGEVPLASLPKTGDNAGQGLAFAMSGVLLALFMAVSKKKEKQS